MKDWQLGNTGVRMLIADVDDMTNRQLVKLLRSRQGPDVFLRGSEDSLYKLHQAEEEANKQDVAICKKILARAYMTYMQRILEEAGVLRFCSTHIGLMTRRSARSASIFGRGACLRGARSFNGCTLCMGGFKGRKTVFKAYPIQGGLPNGVKDDSLDVLVDEAGMIQDVFWNKHCIAWDLERNASGGYFENTVESSYVFRDALSRDIHNRLDAFCEG